MPAIDLIGKKILWIEDESFTLEEIARRLRVAGAKVIFAETLSDALKIITKNIFDLIIIDCMLPIGNECCIDTSPHNAGIKFLQMIRDQNILGSQETPILVLSAIIDSTISSKLRELGVSTILYKPIAGEELFENLLKTIG